MEQQNDAKDIFEKVVKEIVEWSVSIVIAFLIALVLKYCFGTFTTVNQSSMFPTLIDGDKLWLNRLHRNFRKDYKYGDIVVFEAPDAESLRRVSNQNPVAYYKPVNNVFKKIGRELLEIGKISYIKRVIALPGDHVKIEGNKVYVNSIELKEEYLGPDIVTVSKGITDFIVPEGTYFLMGDNRNKSSDCRVFGCIPKEKIEGRIENRVLPLKNFGKIPTKYEDILKKLEKKK